MTQQVPLVFGVSASMQTVLETSARYAQTSHPLLLLGERGTGKTALARYLHDCSGRPGPFVKTSVSAIPNHLEASHLVGYQRGAFTGALHDHKGLLESAQRGTFFLDELGLASLPLQELLLHLLEDRCLRRVGDVRDIPLDVRYMAATNADVDQLVADNAFRRDLLDRFGYWIVCLPPLRNRREDILTLARHFLALEAHAADRDTPGLSREVETCFMAAPWLGNVRELQSVCHYAVTAAQAGSATTSVTTITMAHLPAPFRTQCRVAPRPHHRPPPLTAREALLRAGGNKSRAARLLGISRTHFYRLLAG